MDYVGARLCIHEATRGYTLVRVLPLSHTYFVHVVMSLSLSLIISTHTPPPLLLPRISRTAQTGVNYNA